MFLNKLQPLKRRLRGVVLLCAALALPGAHAAPGDLDLNYGIAGRSFAPVAGADNAFGEAAALQADGKIVIAGRCQVLSTGTTHFCAIRLQSNGYFDLDFNLTGNKLVFAAPGSVEIPRAVAIQPDGKIVIAGQCGADPSPTDTCVVRLLSDGSADNSFGTSGKVKFNFGTVGVQYAYAVSVLPGGKLLLGGHCRGSGVGTVGVCVMRLNADGSLDTTFAGGGRTIASASLLGENLSAMLVRPDGRIVIATECNVALVGTSWDVCVSQLTAAGAWDTTFNGTGTLQLHVDAQNRKPRLALQADGKLIVAWLCSGGTPQSCAVRVDPDGVLDVDFAFLGSFPIPVPADIGEYGLKPLIQSDGRIVIATSGPASSTISGTIDFLSIRVLGDNGLMDSTYTGGGYKTVGTASDRANDAVLLSDGRLVIAGSCDNGSAFTMCSVRLQRGPDSGRNCSMDIDGDGRVGATTDALLLARASLGVNGAAILGGITFPAHATRKTWPAIRDYLALHCGMTGLSP